MRESIQPTEFLRIEQLVRQGQLEDARISCHKALQENPVDPWAWFQFGVVLLHSKEPAEAEKAFLQAIAHGGSDAASWNNLSLAVFQQGRSTEAEAYALKAIALTREVAAHWVSLGNSQFAQCRFSEASQSYREAILRDPKDATIWRSLGASEYKQRRFSSAQDAYERSLQITPDDADTLTNYAFLLSDGGQPQRALKLLHDLLLREPKLVATWISLGYAQQSLGRLDSAGDAYRRALQLQPRQRDALRNLIIVLLEDWKAFAEANALIQEWLADEPQSAEAWALMGILEQRQGQQVNSITALTHSVSFSPDPTRHSTLLLNLQYDPDVSPQQLLVEHRAWDFAYGQTCLPISRSRVVRHGDRSRLRLGFVSADFGSHPIGFLGLRSLEMLDKQACTVTCYSDRIVEDDWTARFRAASNVWRKTNCLTSEEMAEQIRADEIDILVDLMGHSGNRLPVFARQPAPVQVTWLGYVGTTGLAAMDFLLADRFHVREGEEEFYTEKILRMPNGYACYGPPEDAPEVGRLPAGREETSLARRVGVTFGCFNNPAKFSPSILEAWGEILQRTPGSRLLLKYGGLNDAGVQERLWGEFARMGIEKERILLEGWSPHRELLAAYNRVDLALDTQPYSGGLTTCEALWMGVPVITFPGKTFAGRHSVSHLTNAGYPQFIAADAAGYIELAVSWAYRLDELAVIRSEMRERVRQSPLCDAAAFARDFLEVLSRAYRGAMSSGEEAASEGTGGC